MSKRIGIYLGGLALTALGIAIIILSLIGAGPWDTVAVGLNMHAGLTIGTWSIITQVIFTVITWIIEKRDYVLSQSFPFLFEVFFLIFGFILSKECRLFFLMGVAVGEFCCRADFCRRRNRNLYGGKFTKNTN